MRRILPVIGAVAAVCAAAPGTAAASPGVAYGLTDDAWLASGPGSVDDRVTTLAGLGVQVVRFTVRWDQVAPTEPADPTNPQDPAYDWSTPNDVLGALHAHGIDVVLQIVGTPQWSNGGKPSNYLPTSAEPFGAFATAVARQYPWVTKFQIWNEPNQVRWLRPTSAPLYVIRLLNPAYAAIHAVTKGAEIAGGGTAPRGSTGGVSPVAWITAMHRARARLDVYAHNPYPLDPKRETPFHAPTCRSCTTVTMATLSRLERLVARYFPHARIWLTEYGYQSDPPDRILGVAPALQARYEAEGSYVAYRAPRVDLLIHFLYRDEPTLARFQSGLVTLSNEPRPVLAAFELPLAETARSGSTTSLWGQLRAPDVGSVADLERRAGSTWRTLARISATARGYFRWRGTLPRGAVVRVRAAGLVGAPLTVT
jgi:Cellulase (glycosyl hydrolase family 5)